MWGGKMGMMSGKGKWGGGGGGYGGGYGGGNGMMMMWNMKKKGTFIHTHTSIYTNNNSFSNSYRWSVLTNDSSILQRTQIIYSCWLVSLFSIQYFTVQTDDHILDMVFQDDTVFTDDILEDEDCELFVAAEAFSFGKYDVNVTVTGSDGTGDEYIWNPDYMQDRSSSDLIDAKLSGYCIMTSALDAFCNFVIVNNVGDQITMAGTLTTPSSALESGGTLALTGGTGAMAGVIGEATFFANPIGKNFLDIATRFDVDVTLGIIVCRPQKLPVY